MEFDWTIFFDEFAGDFHPTFKKELSRQLFEKGTTGTGIGNFEKHNLQLIVGMKDLQMRKEGNKIYVKIDFITPTSFAFPIDIYWTSDFPGNLLEIHKQDISKMKVDINWGKKFPLHQVLPHLVNTERYDSPLD